MTILTVISSLINSSSFGVLLNTVVFHDIKTQHVAELGKSSVRPMAISS